MTADNLGNLAALSLAEGKYKTAEALFLKTLQGLRRTRGDHHPDVLQTMSHLAELYQSQGRYGDAEAIILKALNTQRRVLGEQHPNTLASTANLAQTYYLHGNTRTPNRYSSKSWGRNARSSARIIPIR